MGFLHGVQDEKNYYSFTVDAARTCIITSFGTCVCSCSWPVDEAGRGVAAAAERDAIYQGAETREVGQGLV